MIGLAEQIEKRSTALTADELAELLNMSRRTVYRLAKQRVIPASPIGSSLRFDPKTIAKWLREGHV